MLVFEAVRGHRLAQERRPDNLGGRPRCNRVASSTSTSPGSRAHPQTQCKKLVDKETLDEFKLKPGQIKENITTTGVDMSQTEPGQVFFIGDTITMEIVGECEPCGKMNALQPGLLDRINHRRGMLALVINGGSFKVGDSIRLEP